MKELLIKELKESTKPSKLVYNVFSLLIISFILWNFSNNVPQELNSMIIPLLIMFLPSYLITFFSFTLVRNFVLDKKSGVIEAILAAGVNKIKIASARSLIVFFISFIQTTIAFCFIEFLIKTKLNSSIFIYLNFSNAIISVTLILLSISNIFAINSISLRFSSIVNYILLLAFSLFFLYAGFYYLINNMDIIIVEAILVVLIYYIFTSSMEFLKKMPNDKIILE